MNHRLLDTNFVVRHVVQDNAAHAETATRLFEATDRGEVTAVILVPVLAECVYVLESFYKLPRSMIADRLSALLTAPNVIIDDPSVGIDALKRYAATKLHFIDCLLAATAAARGWPVATFDSDFRRFGDVRVQTD